MTKAAAPPPLADKQAAVDGDSASDPRIHSYLEAHRTELVGQLLECVRLPSVAGSPERVPNLMRSANWLAAALGDIGFPSVRIVPTADTFTVLAEWCPHPHGYTVLVYSHHDVRA